MCVFRIIHRQKKTERSARVTLQTVDKPDREARIRVPVRLASRLALLRRRDLAIEADVLDHTLPILGR